MATAINMGFSVPMEPGAYFGVDPSKSGVTGKTKSKILVLGPRLAAGTVAEDVLTFIPSTSAAKSYFGRGSVIARMIEVLKLAYGAGEVWAIAQDGDADSVTGTITITKADTSATSGTLFTYIAGQLVKTTVLVAAGTVAATAAAAIATQLAADINAAPDLPVTATANAAVVTLTARAGMGALGNKIDVRMNYYGEAGGETLPATVTVAIVAMSGGTTEPDLDNTILAMVENQFDTIVNPYVLAPQLLDLKTAMADRWSALKMIHGHVCGGHVLPYADLVATFGESVTQNDPHMTILPADGTPTPPWEIAAALAALTAEHQMDSDEAELAQGFTGHLLYGMKPPTSGLEFTTAERDILLSKGLATFTVSGGACYLSRARTTYKTDSSGSPDAAYYDQRTLAILQRIIRQDKIEFQRAFAGAVLVNDASRIGRGARVCSPAIGKGWFAERYSGYEAQGLVTDADRFIADLEIGIHDGDPNRLDILYPPQISGWLAVAAANVQFRLQ